jgi:pyruvate kinase
MRQITSLLPIATIVTYTSSGFSSLRASRERPATSILSMAASMEAARRLTLAWGIHSVPIAPLNSMDEMSTFACEVAEKEVSLQRATRSWLPPVLRSAGPGQRTC